MVDVKEKAAIFAFLKQQGANLMSMKVLLISAVATAIAPAMVGGEELAPLAGATFQLGEQAAVVYYTVAEDGAYRVVTTVAPGEGREGAPVRHVTNVEPGQSYTISVGGFGPGARESLLEVTRHGDQLSVVPAPSMADTVAERRQ